MAEGEIDDVWILDRGLQPFEVADLANMLFADGFEIGDASGW